MPATRPLTQPMADTLATIESRLPRSCGTESLDGRSLAGLIARGLIRPKGTNFYTVTVDGALRILADLAGWTFPADAGDPYVIDLCAGTALLRADQRGVDSNAAAIRVGMLLAIVTDGPITTTHLANLKHRARKAEARP